MYIKVRVVPSAKKETFVVKTKDHFDISVREEAERNMANTRVREIIARHFKITPGKVRIVSGHHSQSKILDVLV